MSVFKSIGDIVGIMVYRYKFLGLS